MPDGSTFHRSPDIGKRTRFPALTEGPATQLGRNATPIPTNAAPFNASKSSDRKTTLSPASLVGTPRTVDHPRRSLPCSLSRR